MATLILSIYIVICIALVVVVLLQQGKGADIGAVFGGSSQTVFGASGAGNALTKATWALAAAFFVCAMYLAFNSTQHATGSVFGGGGPSVMNKKQAAPAPAPNANPAPAAPAAPAGRPNAGGSPSAPANK